MEPEPELLEPEPETEEIPASKTNVVSDEVKQSLESDDPWMQRKQQESQ